MKFLFNLINASFNRIHGYWDSHYCRRFAAVLILLVYLLSLLAIEFGRRGILPESYTVLLPRSHYAAISIAFTFLLYLELIDLVFGLAKSVSRAVGKQFEIFSLILLRQSFKDFSDLPEPLHWARIIRNSAAHLVQRRRRFVDLCHFVFLLQNVSPSSDYIG